MFALLTSRVAFAEPKSEGDRERAAHAYDEGVSAYERAEYRLAAERFLEADALVASADAVANALSAAQKVGDPALLERTAERAVAREKEDAELAKTGRRLLAESKASRASQPSMKQPSAETPRPPANAKRETVPIAAPAAVVRSDVPESADRRRAREKPWPPALFYAGAAGTAVLGSLTIWSGIDTLDARERLPGTSEEDNDSVRARALRTDALLAGTLVLAAATTYVGLAKIRWGQDSEPVALGGALGAQGAVVTARGRW